MPMLEIIQRRGLVPQLQYQESGEGGSDSTYYLRLCVESIALICVSYLCKNFMK